MYKTKGVDAKSEFTSDGQKLVQSSMSAKKRKFVVLLDNYNIFLYVNIFHLWPNFVCFWI